MSEDPKYVTLADHMRRGMQCDTHGSGWSISGGDVKPFPDDTPSRKFVRRKLNAGVLVTASKAEYEEAHEDDGKYDPEVAGHQEHRIREEAAAAAVALANEEAPAEPESEGTDPSGNGEDPASESGKKAPAKKAAAKKGKGKSKE